jgi:hypothetical protein
VPKIYSSLCQCNAPVDKVEMGLGLWQRTGEALRFVQDVARVAPERRFPHRLPRPFQSGRTAECSIMIYVPDSESIAKGAGSRISWDNPQTWPKPPEGYVFVPEAIDRLGRLLFRGD